MLPPGTVVAGYRIETSLGQGGMGVVYEATQLSLNRTVALKFLAAHFSQDVDFRERFRREGVIQAGIDHPHIVPVYEAGEVDDGLFLAMRLIRGSNLKELIVKGDVDAARTMRILAPVAEALAVAHEAGLTHRDIKPQNILVGARDHSYLADFGLTKGPDVVSLTRTGQFLGTLDYVAPETINGQRATDRSDTYALAAVLYECLTGEVPYKRPSEAAVLFAHVSDPPPVVTERRPDLPAGLDEVIARGMAKQPEERYASPIDLLDEAGQAIAAAGTNGGGLPAPAPPVDLGSRAQPSPPPAPTTIASHDAIAPTVPSEHQLDAMPVAEAADSTALLTPPDGTTVPPPAATTELETPAAADWGLEDEGSGTVFDWGRGERTTVADSLPVMPAPEAATSDAAAPEVAPSEVALSDAAAPEVAPSEVAPSEVAPSEVAAPEVALPDTAEVATPVAAAETMPRDEAPTRPTQARRGRPRWPLAAGAGALLILAVGAAIVAGGGGSGGDTGGATPTPTAAAPKQVAASGIGLRYPSTYKPTDAGTGALPGTSAKWPIALAGSSSGSRILAGRLPSTGPTLLPKELAAGAPEPTIVRLGNVDAYRYSGVALPGSSSRADVFAIPTSSGVVTLACVAAPDAPDEFASDCERVVGSLAISSHDVLPLGPDRAFAKRLNSAMTTLNARRSTLRKRLRGESRPTAQARDATDLQQAFTKSAGTVAAGKVGPAVAPDRTAIVKAMRQTAAQYRALAHAAGRNDRRAYNRARTGVRRGEAKLRAALSHLDRRYYTVA